MALLVLVLFLLGACRSEDGARFGGMMGDSHMMDGMHGEEDEHTGMMAMHSVPAEAAAVENPVPPSENSTSNGASLYAANCAVCHGESGLGDGPGGVALSPKPADLTADHVQMNTDGALFYIITHGLEGTGMPAWEEQLNEEERWHLVNFMRTLD